MSLNNVDLLRLVNRGDKLAQTIPENTIIQVICKQSDMQVKTRIGKVIYINETSLILVPHGRKDLSTDIIGEATLLPIDTIQEVILINETRFEIENNI